MRKKQLIQKNNELSVMLHDSEFENERLKNGVKHLRERCEMLERELEYLKDQIAQMQKEKESSKEEVVVCEQNIAVETEIPVVKEEPAVQIDLPDIVEYGSVIIGEIVVASAKYADKLSVHGEKYRELINLILGRTEVEKAKILEIINSDAMLEDKKKMIDSSKANCVEYFDSVMAQRCE